MVSVVTPLLFHILFIWALSLFHFVSLSKDLLISKNKLLVSLIFSILFSLHLFLLCSLLLPPSTIFGLCLVIFFVPLSIKLEGLFGIFFYVSFMPCIALNFPLRTTFPVSHRFRYAACCSQEGFFFYFSFDFFSNHWLFSSMFINIYIFPMIDFNFIA